MSTIEEIAARHGFSADAGRSAYAALQSGGFSQAQFNHPEFGGMGQWMSGGMMMIGDMFNESLKWRVGALLTDLSQHREPQPATPQGNNWGFAQSSNWWPSEFGSPASSVAVTASDDSFASTSDGTPAGAKSANQALTS